MQALLHRYETFHRANGHTVKLPMDRGEGQQWNLAPGNMYSKPQKLKLDLKPRRPSASFSIKKYRRFQRRQTPSTSGTSESK